MSMRNQEYLEVQSGEEAANGFKATDINPPIQIFSLLTSPPSRPSNRVEELLPHHQKSQSEWQHCFHTSKTSNRVVSLLLHHPERQIERQHCFPTIKASGSIASPHQKRQREWQHCIPTSKTSNRVAALLPHHQKRQTE